MSRLFTMGVAFFLCLLTVSCQVHGATPIAPSSVPSPAPHSASSAGSTPSPIPTIPTSSQSAIHNPQSIITPPHSAIDNQQSTITSTPFSIPTSTPSDEEINAAIAQKLVELEKPKTLQSMPSPNGRFRAVVLRYECLTLPGADSGQQNAYELLKLVRLADRSETVLETQLQYCQGLGAAGLKVLSWARNSRYLYYSDAAEGMPDGGCGLWRRPLTAYELASGAKTALAQEPVSPDGRTFALQSGGEMLLWDYANGGVLGQVPLVEPGWTVAAIVWAPGSRSLAYLQTEPEFCGLTGRTLLARVDLPGLKQTRLITRTAQSFITVQWKQAGQIQLTDRQGRRWRLELEPPRLVALSPPDIIYFTGSTLFRKAPDRDPVQVYVFTGLGAIRDSMRVGEQIFVLGERTLQRYDLVTQEWQNLRTFDRPVQFGRLSADETAGQVVYQATFDDPQADLGWGALLGLYDLAQKTLRELPTFHRSLSFLGFTADRNGLLILWMGDDPEFGGISVLDPQTGQELKQIPLYGSLFAVLSPDRRTLATRWYPPPGDPPKLVPKVYLYDLAAPDRPRPFALPIPGSNFITLAWSADGAKLYFHLVSSANFDYNTRTYGVWALDVASGRVSQAAPLANANAAWINLDPQWVLLQSYTFDRPLLLVDLATGKQLSLSLPADAQVVHGSDFEF
ncbi:MAG TPA: hypothetical protein VMT46_19195 [Anaerolineaceae bacterium]|nr:hypothetical protein [Anaerolineaceae bacterium]